MFSGRVYYLNLLLRFTVLSDRVKVIHVTCGFTSRTYNLFCKYLICEHFLHKIKIAAEMRLFVEIQLLKITQFNEH